jgi:hypothetical protein
MNVHRRIAHGFDGLDTDFSKIIPLIFYVLLCKHFYFFIKYESIYTNRCAGQFS